MSATSFDEFVRAVFEAAQARLEKGQEDVSIWSLAAATPKLVTQEMAWASWVLRANLPGHAGHAAMSVAMTAGEVRVGIMLPKTAVTFSAQNLHDAINRIYDGSGAAVSRTLPGGGVLLDWQFHDAPFTADWMLRAQEDERYRNAIVHRLTYIMATIWRGSVEVIATAGRFDLANDLFVVTNQAINTSDLAKQVPCVVYDTMYQSESGQWLTILRSALDHEEVSVALRKIGIQAEVRHVMRVETAEAEVG